MEWTTILVYLILSKLIFTSSICMAYGHLLYSLSLFLCLLMNSGRSQTSSSAQSVPNSTRPFLNYVDSATWIYFFQLSFFTYLFSVMFRIVVSFFISSTWALSGLPLILLLPSPWKNHSSSHVYWFCCTWPYDLGCLGSEFLTFA